VWKEPSYSPKVSGGIAGQDAFLYDLSEALFHRRDVLIGHRSTTDLIHELEA
jgi:hypothetical protein